MVFRPRLLGITIGLAVLSKFSVFLFFPSAVGVLLIERGFRIRNHRKLWKALRNRLSSIVACLSIAAVIVWGGYRFALTPLLDADGPQAQQDEQQLVHALGAHPLLLKAAETVARAPLPGTALIRGVLAVLVHNEQGHVSHFLGRWSWTGWWYFFPLLLLFKTPLPLLILVIIGLALLSYLRIISHTLLQITPALFVLGILGSSLFARINIGIRHVLPAYPLLTIIAAGMLCALLAQGTSGTLRILGGGLVLWFMVSSAAAHPDYLAYFNELAFQRLDRISMHELDWGQDLQRLSLRLRQLGIRQVFLEYHGSADLSMFNLPAFRRLPGGERVSGWVAISAFALELPAVAVPSNWPFINDTYAVPDDLKGSVPAGGGPFSWLKSYSPRERIGKSIFLYYIPALSTESKRF